MTSLVDYRFCAMKTLPVEVHDGVLRMPEGVQLPSNSRLAVLVLEEQQTGAEVRTLADAGGAFDFLREEPDLYSDSDIPAGRRNPRFGEPL